jgi:hypothetical protein
MKVGGGLNYVTGPMGAGKSLYGVRTIVQAVSMERYAITNVELLPGWADRVARHFAWWRGRRARARIAAKLEGFYVYETELEPAMRYRLPGRGESRGVFVWDETHNDLNNRDWRDEGRGAILEWATQLRKLGFAGYLLSQHAENTDVALRRVCSYLVRLQNQREQTRLLGLRVTPWPLFLAAWYPAHLAFKGAQMKPTRVERYFLGWHRHLYDTHGLYHGLAGDHRSDLVLLPSGGRVAPAEPEPGRPGVSEVPEPPLWPAPVSAPLRSAEPVSPEGPRSGAAKRLDSGGGSAIFARPGRGPASSSRAEHNG